MVERHGWEGWAQRAGELCTGGGAPSTFSQKSKGGFKKLGIAERIVIGEVRVGCVVPGGNGKVGGARFC